MKPSDAVSDWLRNYEARVVAKECVFAPTAVTAPVFSPGAPIPLRLTVDTQVRTESTRVAEYDEKRISSLHAAKKFVGS